ncbi:hypothetical protein [Roseovarius sp. C03]|uniref:hypothetical protein n=1 Tax=Roseovarius sp. C03 TaxID=3449222 RepID=UPI003EDB875B
MLSIACPDEDAGAIFAASAARTRSVPLRTALLAQRPHVEARAAQYLGHGAASTLYQLAPVAPHGIDAAQLGGVYGRVLVNGGERPLYDRLRGSARLGRCPLCAQRDAKTLDHYLSKDEYPELAVFPANLTPACFDCNHAKRTYRALAAGEQLFHPYFDDWSAFRLLLATIEVGPRVTSRFSIRAPANVDDEVIARARAHFEQLNLATLYEQHASVELVQRKDMFRRTFDADGADGLQEEMAQEYRSRRQFNRNGWQAALYRALSRSEDFCDGGFEQIDE